MLLDQTLPNLVLLYQFSNPSPNHTGGYFILALSGPLYPSQTLVPYGWFDSNHHLVKNKLAPGFCCGKKYVFLKAERKKRAPYHLDWTCLECEFVEEDRPLALPSSHLMILPWTSFFSWIFIISVSLKHSDVVTKVITEIRCSNKHGYRGINMLQYSPVRRCPTVFLRSPQ